MIKELKKLKGKEVYVSESNFSSHRTSYILTSVCAKLFGEKTIELISTTLKSERIIINIESISMIVSREEDEEEKEYWIFIK